MVSATFNTPIDRVLRKMMNVAQALDSEVETWQRVAFIYGLDRLEFRSSLLG